MDGGVGFVEAPGPVAPYRARPGHQTHRRPGPCGKNTRQIEQHERRLEIKGHEPRVPSPAVDAPCFLEHLRQAGADVERAIQNAALLFRGRSTLIGDMVIKATPRRADEAKRRPGCRVLTPPKIHPPKAFPGGQFFKLGLERMQLRWGRSPWHFGHRG